MTFEERLGLRLLIDSAVRARIASINILERRYRVIDRILEQIAERNGDIALASTEPTYARAWTRQTILEAMRRWVELHGQAPVIADWRDHRYPVESEFYPHPSTVVKAFGGWNAGLREAGLVPQCTSGTKPKRLRCSLCRAWKSDDAFSRDAGNASRRGRSYRCRKCVGATRGWEVAA